MDKATRELRDGLRAKYGKDLIYADVQRLGLVAVTRPDTEAFNEYLGAIFSPIESSGVAREVFVSGSLVYPNPKEPGNEQAVAKVKRFFKAMPQLTLELSLGLEALCTGDYEDYVATDEERIKLDNEFEFGWSGIVPDGAQPIILATDETAGSFVRNAIDASHRGNPNLASIVKTAMLSCVRKPDASAVETLLDERPGLLIPLWGRCRDITGSGVVELGKG